MSSLTADGLLSAAAWALGLSTLAFGALGIHAEKDFFLMMGLVSVLLGDCVFCFYMLDQGYQLGKDNSALATVFACCALFAVYAISCQWTAWREEGCSSPQDEEEEQQEEEEEREEQERLQRQKAAALPNKPHRE